MGFFYTVFFQPFYNFFALILSLTPSFTIWIAVVLTVLFVRFVLLPSSIKSSLIQTKMKGIQPQIDEIKKEKNNEKKTKKLVALYQKHKINPLAILGTLILNLAALITLFFVFRREAFDYEALYSFVANRISPDSLNELFLGVSVFDSPTIGLILLIGTTQFLAIKIVQMRSSALAQTQFAKILQFQLTYVLPIIVMLIAPLFTTSLVLYWIVNNTFSIFQELFVTKKIQQQS